MVQTGGHANTLRRQVLLPFGSGADQPWALVGENARQRPRPELKKASSMSQCANAKEETSLGRCCILKRQTDAQGHGSIWNGERLHDRVKATAAAGDWLVSAASALASPEEGQRRGSTGGHEPSCSGV